MKQSQASSITAHIQAGFIIPAAIFLIVVLAALGAYAVTISTTQNFASAQDVQGSRAYHAARSALEWGVYQVSDPTNSTAVVPTDPSWPNFPVCPSSPSTPPPTTINGFNITFACSTYSSTGPYYENNTVRRIIVYDIKATASSGTVGTPNYIERQLQVTLSKCRATDGVAPSYGCS